MFNTSELQAKFDYYCNKLQADCDFGKIEAIRSVGNLKKKPDQAGGVIQIGIISGGADGNFGDDEKAAAREARFAVAINPSEFNW